MPRGSTQAPRNQEVVGREPSRVLLCCAPPPPPGFFRGCSSLQEQGGCAAARSGFLHDELDDKHAEMGKPTAGASRMRSYSSKSWNLNIYAK